ncbi:MAG TPA: methyltransferase domain-containing protein [Acidimicrobiales bacterium]|jgi:SAM-dependent methyltransferase|nr:methyltransferase domain-containing protein [Acidimicrobiales bacterium]
MTSSSDQVEYQRTYYDGHFPKRAAVVQEQLAHPLFRSFYDRLARLVCDRGLAGDGTTPSPSNGRALRLLEIGCGEGLLGSALHRMAAERSVDLSYTGTDLSAAALELARPSVSGQLIQGDATQVVAGLPAASHDLAVVKNLLHHLDDPADLMRAAARAVGPTGKVVVVEACLGAPQFWVFTLLAPKREKHFFKGRRRNLAAIHDGGLRVVATDFFSWLPYELAFAIRFDWFRKLLATDDRARIDRIGHIDDRLTSALRFSASYIVWTAVPR